MEKCFTIIMGAAFFKFAGAGTLATSFVRTIVYSLLLILAGVSIAETSTPKLKVEKIEDGIYIHTSFENIKGWGVVASNGLVVIDNEDAHIIDTPISLEDTKALVKWIRENDFTVKSSLSTHFHNDSAGGIAYLNSLDIPTHASTLTNKLLINDGREQAKHSFDVASFWLVQDKIEVYYPGAAHTQDNVVVWVPNKKVLFGGCMVKRGGLGNLADAVVADWPSSIDRLINKYNAAKIVVPGHGKIGDLSLLEHTKTLAIDAAASSKQKKQKKLKKLGSKTSAN